VILKQIYYIAALANSNLGKKGARL